MKIPVLETERLILRPITMEDAPALQKHFNNWNIVKYLNTSVPWPYPEDGAMQHLQEHVIPETDSGRAIIWGITLKENGDEVIGVLGFYPYGRDEGCNRGFWLSESFQKRGIMWEAVTAQQDYVFFELGMEKFQVTNDRENTGSRRMKEKSGGVLIKTYKKQGWEGEITNEVWEIIREKWTEIRSITED